MAPELAIHLASGQNAFFVELAEMLADALAGQGARTRIVVDELPEPRRGRIALLIAPSEQVRLTDFRLPPEICARCIGITAERTASGSFETSLELARDLGAVLEINPRAVGAYRRRSVPAALLPIGYHPFWDRFAHADRDIDVLFLGARSDRRDRALARCADTFERFRVHLQLSEGLEHEPATAPSFVAGDDKRALLERAKVLLTVHRDDEPDLDWLRVSEAVCAGAMVVSEHASHLGPLRVGEHLVTASADRLGLVCDWAVERSERREAIRTAAYELLRRERPPSVTAEALLTAARALDDRAPGSVLTPRTRLAFLTARARRQPPTARHPAASPYGESEGRVLRALKAEALASLQTRRALRRLEFIVTHEGDAPDATTVVASSAAWDGAHRTISVLVPLRDHGDVIGDALGSLPECADGEHEVVVVDDGSADAGPAVVTEWIAAHPQVPARLVRHAVNRGLSAARNTAIEHARTDLLLMLDADNLLRPTALGRLREALERDPEADFAYGILDRFDVAGPVGLISQLAWDPLRLRGGNYIDALALIRRSALERVGGYSSDPRLALGWEDFDLWARLAETGGHGAFVPEIIARYRVGGSSMLSATNISRTDAYIAIAEHAPRLMGGLRIPA